MAHKVMPASLSEDPQDLYARDYHAWALDQARALRDRRPDALDWDGLAEELEDLARSEARSLKSQLARLLAHLLKWQLQAALRTRSKRTANSWRASIEGARQEIRDLLDESPGLKRLLPELFPKAFAMAVNLAGQETGIDKSVFPPRCPWSFEQVMDENFRPER
ncbi:MAG: DUF29 domain-containing protein [Candidatus Binataceae bacterium]